MKILVSPSNSESIIMGITSTRHFICTARWLTTDIAITRADIITLDIIIRLTCLSYYCVVFRRHCSRQLLKFICTNICTSEVFHKTSPSADRVMFKLVVMMHWCLNQLSEPQYLAIHCVPLSSQRQLHSVEWNLLRVSRHSLTQHVWPPPKWPILCRMGH